MRPTGVGCHQHWLGRQTEHGYHEVPITCSTGRGLGKVSAAVTRGRCLLRCLVHLDSLDGNLLSHGTTWGERGAHEPVAQQADRPCKSHPGLWPRTAPQHGSALCCKKPSQKPCPQTYSFLVHRGQRGVRWPRGAPERKGKATAAFVQLPGIVQECLGSATPGSTKTQHGWCREENTAHVQAGWSPAPSSTGHLKKSSHPSCDLQDTTVSCTGFSNHWATGYASQTCRGMVTQPPAQTTCCKALWI